MPGRVKCGGTEGEKVVVHGCRKRKKLICGTEGEIVVAHGHLPSPAHETVLSDEPLTSNAAEEFNSVFALSLPKNAVIWALIQKLRKEENSNDIKMRDVLLGLQNRVGTATKCHNLGRDQRRIDVKALVSNNEKLTNTSFLIPVSLQPSGIYL